MITLAHLRVLLQRALTHAGNPAIVRLPESEQTWGHVARAYLPHVIYGANPITGARLLFWPSEVMTPNELRVPLDLTDPGTAHALLVALALALGLDPGVGGVGVRWTHHDLGDEEWWCLPGPGIEYWAFTSTTMFTTARSIHAPIVAAEPDPIKALALAALHVLEHP